MPRLKIETIEVAGFRSALTALRLPYGKDCRSYTSFQMVQGMVDRTINTKSCVIFDDEGKDLSLLSNLVKSGDEHSKTIRGIIVYADIQAPLYWWSEIDTYRVGTERLSSESSMHIQCKGLTGDELVKRKEELPMGHIQRRVQMFSYQTLRRIYFQRRKHRLPIWREFCEWIENLPYSKELITIERDSVCQKQE